MKKGQNILNKIELFIGGGLIILLCFCSIIGTYDHLQSEKLLVRHKICWKQINKYLIENKRPPRNLKELYFNEVNFDEKEYNIRYYPNAWDEDGKIMLVSKSLGSYIVTFGDGTIAKISYIDKTQSNIKNKNSDMINILKTNGILHTNMVAFFFIILLFVFLIVTTTKYINKRNIKNTKFSSS
ncbi:MAG: hypothetical protein GF364_16935 [Candidatus Lokiarchaeota archaeon]|nr:hypothetical protein [Candidatus Lokiarchaeota archaeon]